MLTITQSVAHIISGGVKSYTHGAVDLSVENIAGKVAKPYKTCAVEA